MESVKPTGAARRHRKDLITAIALLAGAYTSYRLYNSAAVIRKRKQLARILHILSLLCEAAFNSAQTLSILSSDLHAFLRSDDDNVPRSLRQVFKLGQCQELQETFLLSSCAITRGVFRGMRSEIEDFTAKGHRGAYQSSAITKLRKLGAPMNCRFHRTTETGVEGEFRHIDMPHGDGSVIRKKRWHYRDRACKDGLPEKLLDKIFSEAGTGFASTIVGSVARNLVLAFFDGLQKPTGCQDENISDKLGAFTSKTVLEFMQNERYRPLISECIQIFVSTSVSVYIEKTKGINVFDDVVAGITNPVHQAPVKEFLSLICKESVETFIKTTRKELFHHSVEESGSEGGKTDESLALRQSNSLKLQDSENFGTDLRASDKDEFMFLKLFGSEGKDPAPAKGLDIDGGNLSSSSQSTAWISGVRVDTFTAMNTDNRKLLVDLVGTMTSEATKTFCEVMVGTFSSFFVLNARRILSRVTPWRTLH